MKKISKVKSKLFYFSLGVIACSVVGVAAATYFPSNDVTYDNTESGLTSTNVQGAIDELYNACKTPSSGGDGILDNVDIVTSGDGLYKDEYEDGRYFYKGANPNNYVTFNNEQAGWRIISIEPDNTIKIIRIASIGNKQWDSSRNTDWNRPASLNTYLNNTYYNNLNSSAKEQIVAGNYSIGEVALSNNDLEYQIEVENETRGYEKIGLPTASEYIRTNYNKSSCGSFNLVDDHSDICNSTNWMIKDIKQSWWTINISSQYGTHSAYCTYASGIMFPDDVDETCGVRPVIYLSPNITLKGNGTKNDPFVIE